MFSFVFYVFFGSFFHHRGCDEQKVRFLYRNGAVYLRSSLWPDLCNNFTLKLFSCEYCKTLASLEILLRGRDNHYNGCNGCHLHDNRHLNDPLTRITVVSPTSSVDSPTSNMSVRLRLKLRTVTIIV